MPFNKININHSSLKILKLKYKLIKTNIIILKSLKRFIQSMILLKLFNSEIK